MTPAEWLAAILLGWFVVSGLWKAIDEPVTSKFHSPFYVVVALNVELALVILACGVLHIPVLGAIAVAAILIAIMAIGEAAK